jgi:3-phosphoshikimate 1-carboxyvinyltransferase
VGGVVARVYPGRIGGEIAAIPSKSHAHRLLICAAFADAPTAIGCAGTSEDIEATARCVSALGARVGRDGAGFTVAPGRADREATGGGDTGAGFAVAPGNVGGEETGARVRDGAGVTVAPGRAGGGAAGAGVDVALGCAGGGETGVGVDIAPGNAGDWATLDCGESGSTYRFLLPVAAALGVRTRFLLSGRLPERPMDALFQAMEAHGVTIGGKGTAVVTCEGRLTGGQFLLPGGVSSQFISGLLMAAPLTGAAVEINLTGTLESRGYVEITRAAMRAFGVQTQFEGNCLRVPGGQRYVSPGRIETEGDWSNAAFFLCAAAAGETHVEMRGLRADSPQGDRAIAGIIERFGQAPRGIEIDLSDIPDLAPAIAVLGAAAAGETRLYNAGRLRMKESDRIASIVGTLSTLGADITAEGDEILIRGGRRLIGGRVDAAGDHRIAMMAAVCAVIADAPIEITNAEAVNKSYPAFFEDLRALGLRAETEEG